MDHQLHLHQSTSLTITPQLQQAIHLLQLPYHELETFLQAHIEQNPLLTVDEPTSDADITSFENELSPPFSSTRNAFPKDLPGKREGLDASTLAPGPTLREHLMQQIRSQISDRASLLVGAYLTQFIQPTGYFEGNITIIADQLGVPVTVVEATLKMMQRFDPSGVCARSLRECLRIQLEDRELLSPPYEVLLNNLELVAKGDMSTLVRKCKVPETAIIHMLQEVRRLVPKPGLCFQQEFVPPVIPEVLVHWDPAQDSWVILLNPETTPKVLLDRNYYARVRATVRATPEKRYLSEQMAHANWLIKALHQRSTTILRVSTEIVQQQQDFFRLGVRHLRPLILKDLAQTLDFHESTISRVTTGKYMATPRGTFELKYFFSSGLDMSDGRSVSSEAVRHRIQEVVAQEATSKSGVLSDDAIALLLQKEGISIARRTVAKYRELLGIPPAFRRKRWNGLRDTAKDTTQDTITE